jgi:tetratricopeptide (TPR) repeat protein
MWHNMHSNVLHAVGQTDAALTAMRRAVELDPNFWFGWAQLGVLYARRGDHALALQCGERAVAQAPWSGYSRGLLAGALVISGRAADAEPHLAALHGGALGGAAGFVSYSLACNNTEEAIDWAAKVAEQRFPSFIPVVLRTFEPTFRESPRWPAVLKTMNLT